MEALEKLIHDELRRNTEMTNDVRGMAQDLKAQLPMAQGARTSIERVLSVIDPTYVACPQPAMDSKVGRATAG